jgi:hypothetical protein
MLEKHHAHFKLPKVKVATIKLFHDFQRLHLKRCFFLNTNVKHKHSMFSTQMKLQVGKLKIEIFLIFKSFPLNWYISQNTAFNKETHKHLKKILPIFVYLCTLRNKRFNFNKRFCSFMHKTSLFFASTQCSFSCLVWAQRVLE